MVTGEWGGRGGPGHEGVSLIHIWHKSLTSIPLVEWWLSGIGCVWLHTPTHTPPGGEPPPLMLCPSSGQYGDPASRGEPCGRGLGRGGRGRCQAGHAGLVLHTSPPDRKCDCSHKPFQPLMAGRVYKGIRQDNMFSVFICCSPLWQAKKQPNCE